MTTLEDIRRVVAVLQDHAIKPRRMTDAEWQAEAELCQALGTQPMDRDTLVYTMHQDGRSG